MTKRFGWKPQLPDHRDIKYVAAAGVSLPESFDPRAKYPEVYDQGNLGSCTANAIAGMVQYDCIKEKRSTQSTPSRLFIYWNERADDGDITTDAGSTIREGIKTLNTKGHCSETLWPYDESKWMQHPPTLAYQMAFKHRVKNYQTVAQLEYDLKHCLAQDKPIAIGISVYDSFMSNDVAVTGVVPMPALDESLLGGHAVLLVGYKDGVSGSPGFFIVRNSWGAFWGDKGYFYLPYEYVLNDNLAADFWCVNFCP